MTERPYCAPACFLARIYGFSLGERHLLDCLRAGAPLGRRRCREHDILTLLDTRHIYSDSRSAVIWGIGRAALYVLGGK